MAKTLLEQIEEELLQQEPRWWQNFGVSRAVAEANSCIIAKRILAEVDERWWKLADSPQKKRVVIRSAIRDYESK